MILVLFIWWRRFLMRVWFTSLESVDAVSENERSKISLKKRNVEKSV